MRELLMWSNLVFRFIHPPTSLLSSLLAHPQLQGCELGEGEGSSEKLKKQISVLVCLYATIWREKASIFRQCSSSPSFSPQKSPPPSPRLRQQHRMYVMFYSSEKRRNPFFSACRTASRRMLDVLTDRQQQSEVESKQLYSDSDEECERSRKHNHISCSEDSMMELLFCR